ncbi:3-hydroxyacyl-CoA dehydrogenase family protein [Clostridiaceae bacterium UIB06]|uniref:L-gulonate 3-dehydrogenase n=1 Tax=Clostridium thailandense TaxID=2794346 RepID=A0A949TEN4_9CLOT|nr:3-hydroxyacyl-CoA dehydrogenase family protein [Clostridium thailandense]MBV7271389.1 3-hydroxyacyl-CoA dehydrogenase family protein [Clostridium thailandense]MCH5136131.1 3-hydroxyacyl-CoA dehydrogenase family protein [Clostridiaceae bacterium UIB06]
MNIRTVSVIGIGTIGCGIALLCAKSEQDVIIYDKSDATLDKGYKNMQLNLNSLRDEGKLKDKENEDILNRIKPVHTIIEAVKNTNLVIECIDENIELKQKIFEVLDDLCPENVILATCTSGLLPTTIAKNTTHPERIVVAHFWNPPHLIPLIEIVPGEKTSEETIDITVDWVRSIGREPISMKKECIGFIGNRLQHALLREALYIVEQGYAEAEEVDKAIEFGFGRRLPATGPICTADLAGLDVIYSVSSYLSKDLCNSLEPSKLIKTKVENNELGAKNGQGFYNWTQEALKKKKMEREEVLAYFLEKDKEKL